MKRNINAVLIGILMALSLVTGALMCYSLSILSSTGQVYSSLSAQRLTASRTIRALELRVSDLDELTPLDVSQPDMTSCSSMVRTLLELNGLNLVNMSASEGNKLAVKAEGDYYGIANFLAGIRTSPSVVRISFFNLKTNNGVVEAELTLELMTEE